MLYYFWNYEPSIKIHCNLNITFNDNWNLLEL